MPESTDHADPADAPAHYDVAVIGAGPAGTAAALRAAELGASVVVLEAGRVGGTRVLLSFRGHGASDALVDGWDYDVLADDVRTVADHVGATACVGLSLGGGALLRVLRDDPERFERLAFVLPAALDSTRGDGATERLRSLGHAIDRGDADEATVLLMAEVPAALRERRGVELLLRRRASPGGRAGAPGSDRCARTLWMRNRRQ